MNKFEGVRVVTEHPVAYDSPDHLAPWGTSRDSSRNSRFNKKLYRLFEALGRPPRVLDLGCSGGGFVRECHNDGCLAVGLEGSDFSLRTARAEWATIGGRLLFTSDIAKPFEVRVKADGEETKLQFDVITSWEVFEHIRTEELPVLLENVKRHLAPDGIVVLSISTTSDAPNGVELHQTLQPEAWWAALFESSGFDRHDEINRYFNTQFVRGPRQWAPGSFTIVLSHAGASPPVPPALTAKNKILDAWHCSPAQRLMSRLLAAP